ncbi:MAG: carbamoyl-phosphate synthase large subunit, partial [Clostridiales bacterium]|nr:carbamoyl-phosphate synthase large subunit [Clostridiales bacterium]
NELSDEQIRQRLSNIDDQRLFVMAEAIRRGVTVDEIHAVTKVDRWFLDRLVDIVDLENALQAQVLDRELLLAAKRMSFTDGYIARLTGHTHRQIKALRDELGIHAVFKMVDTCAAEFDAATPYYYSTYDEENEAVSSPDEKKVLVLGSGPIRIGQGIEFDYCSVHSVWALKRLGLTAIIVNNNPETVSTDFDVSDRLYFEPLTAEDVENIVEMEKPWAAVVQFGGQTAIKLTQALTDMGVPILGTDAAGVDAAEDREKFDEILKQTEISKADAGTVFAADEAVEVAERIGYPVLVRPSYVLGGQGMEIAYDDQDIREYMETITKYGTPEHPILVDQYIMGQEIEVDAICDGEHVLIPGIMEHVERAGVHSGDSISVYPARSLSAGMVERVTEVTRQLALNLHVKGMINIQYIVMRDELYVIEVNPRSSRTVPYISKVTGV